MRRRNLNENALYRTWLAQSPRKQFMPGETTKRKAAVVRINRTLKARGQAVQFDMVLGAYTRVELSSNLLLGKKLVDVEKLDRLLSKAVTRRTT